MHEFRHSREAAERFSTWLTETAPAVAAAAGPDRLDGLPTRSRPVIADSGGRAGATLSWLMRSRRLVRDYETLPAMHEAMVLWSMIMLMSGRLAGRHPGAFSRPAPRAR